MSDPKHDDDEMLEEYDFSNALQGQFRHLIGQPYTTTIHHPDGTVTVEESESVEGTIFLAPDVRAYFPDCTPEEIMEDENA